MYLKRLEIKGFKSFAQNIVLDFLPPKNGRFSVTGVVGPNGSGKSNVVDAIRWVMGEQSIKTLRGKKSEDVIFGGSEHKGALGACEVSMVLDNADGRVEIDFPEIIITRRLYRSGENEYFVNNNPTRLLDIHLLLAKAQFGQHSYSIIGQGTIDKLLTVNPAERKDFLDEASGIKEFQIREHQASLKLNRTEENMKQVERLLAEVEPHLKTLARQVKKLEKRQEVETNLRDSQEKYYASLYWTNKHEIDRLDGLLKNVETIYRQEFNALEKIQNELAGLARSDSRQEVFANLQAKHQAAVKIKNDWERQLAVMAGKMQTAYSQLGKQNIGWLEKKKQELNDQWVSLEARRKELEHEESKQNTEVNDLQKKLDNLAQEKTRLAVRLSQLQTRAWQDQSERQYFEASGLTAVKAVLDNRGQIGRVHGVVAELGEVDDKYRTALEVAAGGNLSSIVVENDEVAKKGIEYLRSAKMGVATFLPLNKISGRPIANDAQNLSGNGVLGLAINLIKFDNKFRDIFSFVFGDTMVVENLDVARRLGIGSWRMVTLEGDLVERRGVMKGGFRQKRRGLSFSSHISLNSEDQKANWEAEMAEAQEEVRNIEKKTEEARMLSYAAQSSLQATKAKTELFVQELKQKTTEKAELERELNFVNMSPEDYSKHLGSLGMEKALFQQELKKSESAVEVIAEEIARFNEEEENKKQRVFLLQEEMQKRQLVVNASMNERNEYKIQLAKIETKQEDIALEVSNEMSMAIVSIAERNNNVLSTRSLEETAAAIQNLKYQLSLIGGIDEEVVKEYGETKERFDFLDGQLTDLKKATGDLTTMIAELGDIMKKKRATAFKKIRKEFDRYFKILFNGGTATLEEIYGESETEENIALENGVVPVLGAEIPMESNIETAKKKEKILTGIEINACPPGKKIKNLSSLSGGERTLTSIALICAILNCNPSPFVVMDEVEAALDEANTMRFANIMAELATQSQFIVITHNRVTMHTADALYGVTMASDGISKILSVELKEVPVEAMSDGKS